jgi:energy-coupling factor transporter ATP-binding protein EcfA2
LTLSVPFEGKAALPTENYRGGGGSTHSYKPLYLSIIGLEFREGVFILMVWAEGKGVSTLVFDLKGVFPFK